MVWISGFCSLVVAIGSLDGGVKDVFFLGFCHNATSLVLPVTVDDFGYLLNWIGLDSLVLCCIHKFSNFAI